MGGTESVIYYNNTLKKIYEKIGIFRNKLIESNTERLAFKNQVDRKKCIIFIIVGVVTFVHFHVLMKFSLLTSSFSVINRLSVKQFAFL